jgi:hypothetical protein
VVSRAADVDLVDFRGRDPEDVLLLLDPFFDDAQATGRE